MSVVAARLHRLYRCFAGTSCKYRQGGAVSGTVVSGTVMSRHSGTVRYLSGVSGSQRAALEERGVVLDGSRLVLHNESRYLCRCSECFGATSNQPLHTDDHSNTKIQEVRDVQDHYVSLVWDDGHVGMIPSSPTGAYGNGYKETPPSRYYDLSLRKNTAQTFWGPPTEQVTKRFQYEDVVSSCEKTKEFLAHFMEFGLAFLSDTPHQPDDLLQILKDLKVTPYWDNMFGVLSKVSFQSDPTNQAFNNQRLAAHTDMPYYTQTPSAYFFHCVANELEGGESFWSDTFSAVQHIRETNPEMFDLLTKVHIPFRQYPKEWHMAGSYPTVEMMGDHIYRVRDCCFVIDTFQFVQDYSPDVRAKWWEAYKYLRELMEDPKRSVQVKLEAGDLVLIDNWRVQHGRNAFSVPKDGQGGRRAMEVSYIEWSHMQNRLLKIEAE